MWLSGKGSALRNEVRDFALPYADLSLVQERSHNSKDRGELGFAVQPLSDCAFRKLSAMVDGKAHLEILIGTCLCFCRVTWVYETMWRESYVNGSCLDAVAVKATRAGVGGQLYVAELRRFEARHESQK